MLKSYLVLKHAGALNLHDLIQESTEKVDQNQLIHLASQLLTAFENVHQAGICHRDLKPDNIIIRKEPNIHVTLIDFNVAVATKAATGLIEGNTGQKEWVAPETRSQSKYDK